MKMNIIDNIVDVLPKIIFDSNKKNNIDNGYTIIKYYKEEVISSNKYDNSKSKTLYVSPEEISSEEALKYFEGAKYQIIVNVYERNEKARKACIKIYGERCTVCGMSFNERYGEIGKGFIHVHHKVPLNTIGEDYQVDSEKDLIPVCPNCHAMLHRKIDGKELTVEKLKIMLDDKKM
jgi:predicted HNH restriction endonuclease